MPLEDNSVLHITLRIDDVVKLDIEVRIQAISDNLFRFTVVNYLQKDNTVEVLLKDIRIHVGVLLPEFHQILGHILGKEVRC